MILILLILSALWSVSVSGINCTAPSNLVYIGGLEAGRSSRFVIPNYSNITYISITTVGWKRSALSSFNGTFYNGQFVPLLVFNVSAGEECIVSQDVYLSDTSTFYIDTTCNDPFACNFQFSFDGSQCVQQCGSRTCGPDACGGHCGYCDGLCSDGICSPTLSHSNSQTPSLSSTPSSTPPDSPSSLSSPESLTPSEKAGVSVGVIGVAAAAGAGWFYFAKYYRRKDKDVPLSSVY